MDTNNVAATSLDQLEALRAEGKLSEDEYAELRAACEGSDKPRPAPRIPSAPGRWGKSWTNRQIGGVCGGIAEASGISVWLLRIGFIVAAILSGGTAVLAYVVLYMVLPWKEDEKHLVWRFPVGFVCTSLALWLIFIFLIQHFGPFYVGMAKTNADLYPAAVKWWFNTQWRLTTFSGLSIQLVVLVTLWILYGIAPREGSTRHVLFGTINCGLFVLDSLCFALVLYAGLALGYSN